jgi:hypothetical protein
MKKLKLIAIPLGVMILVGLCSLVYEKSWFFYYKPAFKGRMVDNETKQPIEGVVVVAIYGTSPWFCLGPGGCSGSIIHVRETLTDKNGEFYIPSYTAIIQPFDYEGDTDFIIYKPGYGSYDGLCEFNIFPFKYQGIVHCGPSWLFSQERTYGEKITLTEKGTTITFTFGEAELPRLKTKDERMRAFPSLPTDYRKKDLPLLYKAINEDGKNFRLGEIY